MLNKIETDRFPLVCKMPICPFSGIRQTIRKAIRRYFCEERRAKSKKWKCDRVRSLLRNRADIN